MDKLITYPGDKTMADVLRHHLVFLQLFKKDILVEAENILQITED